MGLLRATQIAQGDRDTPLDRQHYRNLGLLSPVGATPAGTTSSISAHWTEPERSGASNERSDSPPTRSPAAVSATTGAEALQRSACLLERSRRLIGLGPRNPGQDLPLAAPRSGTWCLRTLQPATW